MGAEFGPGDFGPGDFEAVDAIAEGWQRRGAQPGLAYGVVSGGRLVHAGGLGRRRLDGGPPDAGTVFRIASMTKSFTASAVLALRDQGALRLDDPAADYVPELRGWRPACADAPPVRIRHLLTMTGGFPTDDPWGDREQGTPLDRFSEFLADGVSFAWAPGTRFEYSNLGYAILGRVVAAASGRPYRDFVVSRLLRPLGLTSTGFEASEFGADRLASGYRRRGGGWIEVPLDPYGAFAPMGGVFSCVADLAVWMAGLAAAFPPGEPDTGGPHPLARASRREMQLPHVGTGPRVPVPLPGGLASAGGYGFGLFTEEDPRWGRIVWHSGGYPGFGSNMRWHLASGTGVVVLGNSTYAPASALASWLLGSLLRQRAGRNGQGQPGHGRLGTGRQSSDRQSSDRPAQEPAGTGRQGTGGQGTGGHSQAGPGDHGERALALAPVRPWPETLAARERVNALLKSWDDAEARELFSENVALDEPFADRQRQIARVRERLGEFRDDGERPPEFDSPAHCRWWLEGEVAPAERPGEARAGHGTAEPGPAGESGTARSLPVQVEIKLTPERSPRVQVLTLAVPPAPGSPLVRWLDRVIAVLNDGPAEWPASLPAVAALDTGLLLRRLRMAGAWAGRCRPVACRAGDGDSSVTVELDGTHAPLVLSVAIERTGDRLQQADIMLGT